MRHCKVCILAFGRMIQPVVFLGFKERKSVSPNFTACAGAQRANFEQQDIESTVVLLYIDA